MARGLPFLGLTIAGLLLLSIPFWIWPIDLSVASSFYDAEAGWRLRNAEPWETLYHFGTVPAVIFTLSSIAVLLLGFWKPRWARWRKLSIYFTLCLVVGPGILVNLVFKDQWGRPRPRDVVEFGGAFAHEKVWEFDKSSPGKSFPCGHCSMGFYFFAIALTLRRRRKFALAAAGGATVLGVLIGMARVIQGGHFLSDVLWAGGFCLLTSIGLFYALGLDRSLFFEPKSGTAKRPPPWAIATTTAVGIAVLLGVMLGTPYHRAEHLQATFDAERYKLSLTLEGSHHRIEVGDLAGFSAELAGEGFGLPGSAIKHIWKDEPPESGEAEHYIQLKQRRSGFFTEIRHRNVIQAPASIPGYAKVVVKSGDLDLDLSKLTAQQSWNITVAEPGVVRLKRPANPDASAALKLEIDAAEVVE